MNLLREKVRDQVVLRLVKRFLRAGVVMPDGLVQASTKGSPQGGPLSPLLSNIYLDRFDRLLESRGHRFCRYADDCVIFVRSERAGARVRDSCTRYLEEELLLRVNREKTHVGSPADYPFLGFNIVDSRKTGKAMIAPSPAKIEQFKDRVRATTKRNRGVSPECVIQELATYVRGWFGYYGVSDTPDIFDRLDGWMRRRVRQFFLKKWKRKPTIVRNLLANYSERARVVLEEKGIPKARENGCRKAASIGGWWVMSHQRAVHQSLRNDWLRDKGMYFMMDDWEKVRERCFNRRVPNGTHGGVRGRLAN